MKMLVAFAIEPRRPPHLESHSRQPQDIPEKQALRPVVLSRIDRRSQRQQKRAHHREMQSAHYPQRRRAQLPATRSSYEHVQRAGQNFQRSAFQRQNFAVHHDVHRRIQREFDSLCRRARRQLWCDVRPVKRRGKLRSRPSRPIGPQRTYSIWPSVASAFGAIIILSAGEFAVVECQKQAGPPIPLRVVLQAIRKRRMLEPCQPRQHAENVAQLPQRLKRRFVVSPTSAGKPRLSRLISRFRPSRASAEAHRTRAALRSPALRSCAPRRAC